MLTQLREGLDFALGTPRVFLILLLLAFIGTFGYNFTVMLPLLARFVLHVQSVGFGVMTSMVGVGSVLAGLSIAYTRSATEKQLLLGAAAFSLLLILVGLSHWFGVTLVLLVLLGFAGIIFTATANTRLQLSAPDRLRGRVMSLYILLFAGTTPIGSFLLGNVGGEVRRAEGDSPLWGHVRPGGDRGAALQGNQEAGRPSAAGGAPFRAVTVRSFAGTRRRRLSGAGGAWSEAARRGRPWRPPAPPVTAPRPPGRRGPASRSP